MIILDDVAVVYFVGFCCLGCSNVVFDVAILQFDVIVDVIIFVGSICDHALTIHV